MSFIGWMYDLAREQSPSEERLDEIFTRSREVGYHAVALYLEHRFAYPSAPWAAGPACLTPEVARRLIARHKARGLRIIPFLNTLGHMEGFIRAEGGQWLRESDTTWGSEQTCATRPECREFAWGLVSDALSVFDDEWVHLGGDEARQLGECPACAARLAEIGKAGLFGQYYGEMCRRVLAAGRRPGLWSDMVLLFPEALDHLPRETLLFDWQYDHRPRDTTRRLRAAGFDVICCPAVHTYDSVWCHLDLTRTNIDEHAEDAAAEGALGVLVTTWENHHFTSYAASIPLVYAAGRRLSRREDWIRALLATAGPAYTYAAEILGNGIPSVSDFLRPGRWRRLRDALVLRLNPFRLWVVWRDEATGRVGDRILALCGEVDAALPSGHPLRFPSELHRVGVLWVRAVEDAYRAYVDRDLEACSEQLAVAARILARLRPGLQAAAEWGGSHVDLERLNAGLAFVETVRTRVRTLPPGAYRPAFQTLVNDRYLRTDQAGWMTTLQR
ncbi:MAG: family 20 glycosylhydrolase [Phycisphaerales bacterium]|nr:family 20 glycosylhydrolase [Phycisphaerales bacterium]